MKYFDDLEFVCWGKGKKSRNFCKDRLFPGYCGLQFVNSGAIQLKVGSSATVQTRGPVCFFTMPGTPFSYSSPQEETREHYFVCFKGERIKRYVDGGLFPSKAEAEFYPAPDLKEFLGQWKILLSHLRNSKKNSHAESVLILEKMLLDIASAPPVSKSGSINRTIFSDLAARISEDPGLPWDPEKEAAKLGISMVHFRRLFHEVTGMPVWQYVIGCRIRYAAQMLTSTNKLVKEIASECGFNSVFHFSREFKKIMKKSPDHFRKSI